IFYQLEAVDFNAEPELMPKTPSQKKNSPNRRFFFLSYCLNEEEPVSESSTSEASCTTQPKRTTRRKKQTKPEVVDDVSQSPHGSNQAEEAELMEKEEVNKTKEVNDAEVESNDVGGNAQPPESCKIHLPEVVVSVSHAERLSAELAKEREPSPGRTAAKIAIAETSQSSQRSSVRCSLKLRHSLAGLRHSMTQESVRRASRRSMLKRKGARTGNSTCSSKVSGKKIIYRSTKRKAPDTADESPTKRFSPPKKSQSAIKPHMKSFLHTVHKNQMLMMTPNSVGRTAVIKSFIKHNTPLRIDPKVSCTKERNKLEALKKKQEQEEERMRKMEEEKKKKQEELKRKRDERLRRVLEAKVKEEQREEEKKKKIEQKMAQIDEKNDKRLAEEKAKKKVALKRQEELEQKRKMEEDARKKIQQEEEKRQQELLAKKKAEEEARKALELERERERQAAAERSCDRSVISTPVGKGGGLNVTVDIEHSSPQSYAITPKGGDKPLILSKSSDDYGMDQNSDDSTDDESAPRKPIPSWAEGM
uniref:Inner centromere protein ARK-binding domain-containing protein n=1 Tax=Amphilophus citrinellus TaxID=61819 RepID=A0A3Q0RDD9_AMPCI